MKVLGIRFCSVTPEATELADFLDRLGMPQRDMSQADSESFTGAIFPAGDHSWVELWQPAEGMPVGVMLQVIVDDADAFAENAKNNGIEPQGPMDAHGERIYFLQAPSGMQMSFQSRLEDA